MVAWLKGFIYMMKIVSVSREIPNSKLNTSIEIIEL